MTVEIGFVSCVKGKQDCPAKPRDLYTSDYFNKMQSYAEEEHDEWWILSAKHGLLDPEGPPIEPYDETLTGARVAKERDWAEKVYQELEEAGLLKPGVHLVFHAGQDYHEELLPKIRNVEDVSVEIPTEGLSIGEKLSWYKQRNN